MTDEADQVGAGPLGERPGGAALVLGGAQADLDELVVVERPREGVEHAGVHARVAHPNDGPELVGERAQVPPLEARELRASLRGLVRQSGADGRRGVGSPPAVPSSSRRGPVPPLALALALAASLGLAASLAGCRSAPAAAPEPAPEAAPRPEPEAAALAPAPDRAPAPPPEPEPSLALARSVVAERGTPLAPETREAVAHALARAERVHGLGILLLAALIEEESRFQPRAEGPRGALGLMQVRPFVGRDVAKRHELPWDGPETLLDPVRNVRIGTAYLAELHERFGSVRLAVAAWNLGPTRLARRLEREGGDDVAFAERVLARLDALRATYRASGVGNVGG